MEGFWSKPPKGVDLHPTASDKDAMHIDPISESWTAALLLGAGAVLLVLNLVTVLVFAHDKRAARRGARRVPERTLHTLELLGGWPGSLVAQRLLRHKTAKASYRRAFRAIVGLHVVLLAFGGWLAMR